MDARVAAGQDDLVVLNRAVPQLHIIRHGIVERDDVLVNDGKRSAKHGSRHIGNRRAVETHLAFPWLIQPAHEFGDGGLATPRTAHERDPLARLQVQVEILD